MLCVEDCRVNRPIKPKGREGGVKVRKRGGGEGDRGEGGGGEREKQRERESLRERLRD